jgi:alpha-ketoglutarate-dependent taurine dioxygenase
MERLHSEQPRPKPPGASRRQAVSTSREEWVTTAPLAPEEPLPIVVKPAMDGVRLKDWSASHRDRIDALLRTHGGILFRDFDIASDVEFEDFMRGLYGELLEYSYRSTPRQQVSGRIYTSTEYPADQSIPFHNEMSYTRQWPMKIAFFCVTPAKHGGETPIADSRRVFASVPPAIRERFAERQVLYVRNYGEGLDLTWQNVFQTEQPSDVEKYCRTAGIDFEWLEGGRLRTRQVCQAVARHPATGEMVWFNQAHLFHISSLPPETRQSLLDTFDERDLPRNTYYGDGSAIELEALDAIRAAYDEHSVTFAWQPGDIVLLDNMLTAHARRPFVGPRKIVVGMAESMEAAQ